MANSSRPFGLKPVKHLDGSAWNQVANMYYIPASDTNAYYIGDAVKALADGDLVNGVPGVVLAGTRNAALTSGNLRGVIVGVGSSVATPGGNSPQAFDPDNLNVLFIPATKTKAYYVWVVDSPDVIFEAQADTFANTAFNKNVPLFVANAPTAPQNQSASYAQGSAAATTQALPLKVVGAPASPDNDTASPGTNARIYVKINQHELANNTVGV